MHKKQCFTGIDIGKSLMLTGKDYNEALKQYKCHVKASFRSNFRYNYAIKASLRYSLPTIKASS